MKAKGKKSLIFKQCYPKNILSHATKSIIKQRNLNV